jgi:hypothetical protein
VIEREAVEDPGGAGGVGGGGDGGGEGRGDDDVGVVGVWRDEVVEPVPRVDQPLPMKV